MSLARERLEFAPPRTPGMIRALILAVLAHAVLIGVLTAGVAWKRDATLVTAEAELWSAVPQEAAAPAPLEPPPAPPEQPPVPVEPVPEPKPQPAPEPAPEPPKPDPSIALAKEKAKQLKDKQEQDQLRKAKLEEEKLKKEKLDKLAKDKEKARDKEKANEKAKELAKAKAAEQKAKDAKAKAEEKKLEALRQQQIQRMAGLAGSGGSGAANSTSTALQSSAPSASYAGRVRARIKPNITYIETIVGNPTTEIEVRTSPDGTIISSRVVKASGTKSWDNAAINAIEKTGVLPRDENGRVPSSLIIVLSPRELIGN